MAPAALTIRAYQIAEAIDIRRCRAEFPGKLVASPPKELFYRVGFAAGEGFLYLMDYGVAIFAGGEEAEIRALILALHAFAQDPLDARVGEDFIAHSGSPEMVFGYNEVRLPSLGEEELRIVMLYVGQSAALDHYEVVVERMLGDTAAFARELERHGRLKSSSRQVQRFIGRTLSIRNRIIDNLYIMDAPEITWESEYLDKIDRNMKKTFDVAERFRSLDLQLREIKENLELFAELIQFRRSNMLEWIIIALILVEVANLFRELVFGK